MDQIIINELTVHCRIGVPAQERAHPQRLLLTVEMAHDFVHGDELEHTIDYHAVARRLVKFGEEKSWKLIETFTVAAAEMILREFKPKSVTLEVKKFILPETKYVAVKITRTLLES